MNKLTWFLCLAFMVFSSACFAVDAEVRVNPYYIVPGDDDSWDNAFGVEAQFIKWVNPNVGVAFAAGIGTWEANDEIISWYDPYDGLGYAVGADGSATTVPIGGSVIIKPLTGGPAELTLEGGLRYVIVSSDVDLIGAASDGFDSIVVEDEVDIDNGVVGLFGADISFPLSPQAKIGFGAGYQFDIEKGDVTWLGEEIGDNEMKGFFLRVGISIDLK